jgi:hypothetical protein
LDDSEYHEHIGEHWNIDDMEANIMPHSEQRLQRKLAAKKKKKCRENKCLARLKQELSSLAGIVKLAREGRIIECTIGDSSSCEVNGMITISLVRGALRGEVVWASFMIDTWCLGVKDCFAKLLPVNTYYRHRAEMSDRISVRPIASDVGHALVLGAIDYAHSLGLDPHQDCLKTLPIWNGIPIGQLPRSLEFGRNGRPCYVVGPYDDHDKQCRIVNVLNATIGEGEFELITAGQQFASAIGFDLFEEL